MIAAVCLGFFGAILALVGMKCTKIGGSETTKARLAGLAGLHFILNGRYMLLISSASDSTSEPLHRGSTVLYVKNQCVAMQPSVLPLPL